MIPAITIFLCYALLSPIAALLGFPWTWITGDITFLYRFSMWIAATGVRMAGIRVDAEGLENVPRGQPCIFMANHVSNLDPPVLLPEVPGRTAVFVKSELMKIPFIGMGMRMGGFVAVARSGNREDARESIERATKVLASGVHLTAFPEGTRSRTGKMLPFKKGPFYLAKETGAPCIPVSISGTENMMAKGSLKIRRGTAHIEFHAPVYPDEFESREALLEAVRAAVASGLPEWMR